MPHIVVFDNEVDLCCPMTWDKDCDGALCAAGSKDAIATFHDRADALRAIKVSAKFAEMNEAQGQIANEDFLPGNKRYVKVRRLSFPTRLPWKA